MDEPILVEQSSARQMQMQSSLLEPWGRILRAQLEKHKPGTSKELKDMFAWMPENLRVGRWSWLPALFYWAVAGGLAWTLPLAIESFEPMPEAPTVWVWRLVGLLYGSAVAVWVLWQAMWPLASWTILGWMVATLRYLVGVLGLRSMQRVLMFPSLMANTVTVVVWYLVLVPGFVLYTPKGERMGVIKKWIVPPLLITVHGINFPFCFADWYIQPIKLDYFDLWAGFAYCFLYVTFYLLVLDQMGVHFYFILTPRAWWGAGVYAGILAFAYGIWWSFNSYAEHLLK